MTRVEFILGNMNEDEWQRTLAGRKVDCLELSQWDAQKTRLRKNTVGGEDVVISLDRDVALRDGDVLVCDENRAIVCRIALCEVMVVRLSDADPTMVMERCVRLGHALGNQHWPAVVSKGHVYVPLSVARKVMDSVMRTHAFEGMSYDFLPGEHVLPLITRHEARRLFGGAEQPGAFSHEHGHEHEHEHKHGHEHCHSHDHKHDHDHKKHHEASCCQSAASTLPSSSCCCSSPKNKQLGA